MAGQFISTAPVAMHHTYNISYSQGGAEARLDQALFHPVYTACTTTCWRETCGAVMRVVHMYLAEQRARFFFFLVVVLLLLEGDSFHTGVDAAIHRSDLLHPSE